MKEFAPIFATARHTFSSTGLIDFIVVDVVVELVVCGMFFSIAWATAPYHVISAL